MKTYTIKVIEHFLVSTSDGTDANLVKALLERGLATSDNNIVRMLTDREVIVIAENKDTRFFEEHSKVIVENAEKIARLLRRISELQCHIEANERTIDELEREVAAKDEIIRKQAVMMVEGCGDKNWTKSNSKY